MITSDILLFVRVAETSSFKEAARQLNISASQASKRIASIEDEHGARLFYRTSRNISLTSAGETLLEYYRRIYQMIEESRSAIGQLSKPCGRLRFSVPTCLGAVLLPKLHAEFAIRYPQIQLDAHTSESFVDVVAGGYDVVIRVAQRLTDSTLIARRLATSPLVVAAAPDYLERQGTPVAVAELARHQCVGLESPKPCLDEVALHDVRGCGSNSRQSHHGHQFESGIGARCALRPGIHLCTARRDRQRAASGHAASGVGRFLQWGRMGDLRGALRQDSHQQCLGIHRLRARTIAAARAYRSLAAVVAAGDRRPSQTPEMRD